MLTCTQKVVDYISSSPRKRRKSTNASKQENKRKNPSKSNTSKKSRNKKKKRKKTLKDYIINFVLFLLLLIGLAFVFNGQIKNWLVSLMSSDHQVSKISSDQIKKNEDADATFDFAAVNSVDWETVLKARLNQDKMAIIGGIAIPSVQLNLPIIKGQDNYALAVGAGTMKADQKMGYGNYPLASHHMINKRLLFSPLYNVKNGDTVYLTDLEYIYVYKITESMFVEPNRVDLIDDVEGQTLLTLVTCDNTGANRLIVRADYKKKVKMNKATKEMKDAFDLAENN